MKHLCWLGLTVSLAVLALACDDGGKTGGDATDQDGGAGGSGGGGEDCVFDDGCADAEYCDDGACRTGCRFGGCADGEACDPDSRECVSSGCGTDADCPADQYCADDGICASGCRPAADGQADTCPDGEACDPSTRACEGMVGCCGSDGACSETTETACTDGGGTVLPEGTGCDDPEACGSGGGCEADTDCPEGQRCDPASSTCVPGCRAETDEQADTCPSGEVCDAETGACVADTCDDDVDCADGRYCDKGGSGLCVEGCRFDPDTCPAGQRCGADRTCVADGCDNDDDCDAAQYCTLESTCVPRCGAHADCADDSLCTPEGRCEVGCRDDRDVEPDDSADEASGLVFEAREAAVPQARLCPDSTDDWYQLSLDEGGVPVGVALLFEHDDGDLDVELVDADGNVLAVSDGREDAERIDYPGEGDAPLMAGDYFIRVYSLALDAGTSYDLAVTLGMPGAFCADDEWEPGDTAPAGATAVLQGAALQQVQRVEDHSLCAGDADWFTFTLNPNDGLTVTLDNLGNGMDAEDQLLITLHGPGLPGAADSVERAINGQDGDGNPQIIIPPNSPALGGGAYYLEVTGADADQFADYAVVFDLDRALAVCEPDAQEENDVLADATVIENLAGFTGPDGLLRPEEDLTLAALTACDEDDDWYALDLAARDTLLARAVRDAPSGPMQIQVLDGEGQVLGGFEGQGGNIIARAREVEAAGTYYVVVRSVVNTQDAYELVLRRVPAAGECAPDDFDAAGSNDVRANATPVAPGFYGGLSICDGDTDWFELELGQAANVTVRLDFLNDIGDIDVFLTRGAGAEVDDDQGVEDGALVEGMNLQPGTYYIEVLSLDPNVYDMEIEVVPTAPVCDPDPEEGGGNDTFDTADPLAEGADGARWICDGDPRDEDWLDFTLPAGERATIALEFDHTDDGDLGLSLHGVGGGLVQGCQNSDDPGGGCVSDSRTTSDECIDIEADPGERTFGLRVYANAVNGLRDSQVDYTVRWETDRTCAELVDRFAVQPAPTLP